MALAYMGLKPGPGSGKLADSADPVWLDRESPPPAVATQHNSHTLIANGEVAISSLSALAATVDLMCMRLRNCMESWPTLSGWTMSCHRPLRPRSLASVRQPPTAR